MRAAAPWFACPSFIGARLFAGEGGEAVAEPSAPAEAAPASDIHSTWTTSDGSQTALDACDGSLVVQPYGNAVPVGAIHNYCGGDSIPKESGYLIQVDGATYRSLGVATVLNFYTDDTLDIPQIGDFQIQTCWPNKTSMALIAFERV